MACGTHVGALPKNTQQTQKHEGPHHHLVPPRSIGCSVPHSSPHFHDSLKMACKIQAVCTLMRRLCVAMWPCEQGNVRQRHRCVSVGSASGAAAAPAANRGSAAASVMPLLLQRPVKQVRVKQDDQQVSIVLGRWRAEPVQDSMAQDV
eukprot:359980-Chlamydomonas_euryale.AAC.7